MTVLVSTSGAVATITLNRPDRLNALDFATRSALIDALVECDADTSIGAIVLTGSGRAFCVGQDLSASEELRDAGRTVAESYNPIVEAITRSRVPVIAAVNGAAVGAGMGLALSCDVVLLSERASMACVFSKIGLVPDTGTSWALVRAVGYFRAFELAASGRSLNAEEVLQLSLATEILPHEHLLAYAHSWASTSAAKPRVALSLTKQLLREAQTVDLETTLQSEARSQTIAGGDHEHLRLREAFLTR